MDENNVVPEKLKATLLLNYSKHECETLNQLKWKKNALSYFGKNVKLTSIQLNCTETQKLLKNNPKSSQF